MASAEETRAKIVEVAMGCIGSQARSDSVESGAYGSNTNNCNLFV